MRLLGLATSHDADIDFAEIFEHSRESWGDAQAKKYVGHLRARLRRLREYPELGTDRPDLYPGIRCITVLEHRIFYIIREDRVYVVRVLHVREDAEAELGSVDVD